MEGPIKTSTSLAREWCLRNKIPCAKCGELFKPKDGVTKMPHLGGEYKHYHYPNCPPVLPEPSKIAPGMNHNTDEGWE